MVFVYLHDQLDKLGFSTRPAIVSKTSYEQLE